MHLAIPSHDAQRGEKSFQLFKRASSVFCLTCQAGETCGEDEGPRRLLPVDAKGLDDAIEENTYGLVAYHASAEYPAQEGHRHPAPRGV